MLRFGPYEVHEELGRGGMGVVYRGFDPLIRRDVALKTIKLSDIADGSERRQMQERLEREAQSAGRLSHPSIVTIYQIGYEELRPGETVAYIAMEYVAGWTLAAVLERTRVANRALALSLLRQAAEGLDHAHSQGVIHRDVKPANLLITPDGRLKIADFGLAKLLSHTMTMTGTLMGSPFYMSPEQVRANRVDGRSDQYALAVVAYEVFGGRKPYQAESLSALVYKIAHEEPPLLELEPADLAGRLNPVLRRAMSKEPGERFPGCVAFINELERACAEPGPVPEAPAPSRPQEFSRAPASPPPPEIPPPLPRRARRIAAPGAAIAAAFAVVAALALGVKYLGTQETPARIEVVQPQPAVEPGAQPGPASRPAEAPSSALPAAVAPPSRPPASTKPAPRPERQSKPAPPVSLVTAPVKPPENNPAPAEQNTQQASPPPAPVPAPQAQPEPAREPVRTAPKLLQQAPAPYTDQARAAGIQGAVLLSVDIDERGFPVRARVLKPLDPGLDRSAIQSLAGWRFQPATADGKPVGATVNVEVKFNLVGGPARQRPSLKPPG